MPNIHAPRPPQPPPPFHFPVIATVAPVAAAMVLWAVTGSAFTLMFAALGPVIAIAGLVDARRSARRTSRRASAAFDAELATARSEIGSAHDAERAALDELHPAGSVLVRRRGADPGRWRSGPPSVVLGRAGVRSAVRIESHPHAAEPYRGRLAELAGAAEVLTDAPIRVPAALGIGVCGPPALTAPVLRALAVQLAWSASPGEWALGACGEPWVAALPHTVGSAPAQRGVRMQRIGKDRAGDGDSILLAAAEHEALLPAGCGVVIVVEAGVPARLVWHPEPALRGELTVDAVGEREAADWAVALRAEAARHGLADAPAALPATLALGELPVEGGAPGGLVATLGVTAAGPLTIDLVEHGPHAIVGGTTGSGKSELLVAWVVALAARYPPHQLAFLLVDFKGGAAFAQLAALPHTTGTITDLDAGGALRALTSLRAEVRYREHAIAAAGARDIGGARDAAGRPLLARLVIMVDEFAAMLTEHADLHALFADLAARGRSLGIHLVLCTQRPAGAVRDAVLANADLRISLRVNNGADSLAVVGSEGAASIPAQARGRGLVSLAGSEPGLVQFALASDADVALVRQRWSGAEAARRPWVEPLPAVVEADELPAAAEGHAFGLLDRPHEQRRDVASWSPHRHGSLLVLGAPGSGTSTALSTIAAAARAQWLPRHADAAWDAVSVVLEDRPAGVLALDDLDALVARFPVDHRSEFTERLARVARESPEHGLHLVAAMKRIPGELQTFASLLPARLFLRHANRQDLVLAGGEVHDGDLPPGGGRWLGERVQVARGAPPQPEGPGSVVTELPAGASLAVVSTRPLVIAGRLAAAGYRIRSFDDIQVPGQDGRFALIGDVDEWQSRWGLLPSLRTVAVTVFDACTTADLRQLTRNRQLPPLLAAGQAWLIDPGGGVLRTVLP